MVGEAVDAGTVRRVRERAVVVEQQPPVDDAAPEASLEDVAGVGVGVVGENTGSGDDEGGAGGGSVAVGGCVRGAVVVNGDGDGGGAAAAGGVAHPICEGIWSDVAPGRGVADCGAIDHGRAVCRGDSD